MALMLVCLCALVQTAVGQNFPTVIKTVAGGGPPSNVQGTTSYLDSPVRVAADSSGNVYIAVQGDGVIRKVDINGIVTTVAGGGTSPTTCAGSTDAAGDGCIATNAVLGSPGSVSVDALGNLFFVDILFASAQVVRRIDHATQVVTTVAGGFGGVCASATNSIGDNCLATNAVLSQPSDAVADSFGNVFIADAGHNRIRKVDTAGIITTVAGNGIFGSSGDAGPATSASIGLPQSVSLDGVGNLFIVDQFGNTIRMVNTSGVITRVAGGGPACAGATDQDGDGCPATQAFLNIPEAVFVDPLGDLFIAQAGLGGADPRIRRVDHATQIITTVAGTGTRGFSGDNGPATSATLAIPTGVTLDSAGNLLIADNGNNRVRKVNSSGTITTLAGNGSLEGDGGAATSAIFNFPQAVALDSAGNLFIADSFHGTIREVFGPNPPAGRTTGKIATVAGGGSSGGNNIPATSTILSFPSDVFVDGAGNLFIVEAGFNEVHKVNTSGIITTIAGNGTASFSGDGGAATSATLSFPEGAAIDASGNLFIADTFNNRIRKVDTAGIITTVAGNGTAGFGGDGGPATSAMLNSPQRVAVDGSGNLFIADQQNNCVRQVNAAGIISTVAGTRSTGFSGDGGPATSASFAFAQGVSQDSVGNLFIADGTLLNVSNSRIRKMDHATKVITTVAGNGTSGFSGDGGSATSAGLNDPTDVVLDANGDLFIADAANNRIREVLTLPLANPQSKTTPANTALNLTLTGASPRGNVPLTFAIVTNPAKGTLSNLSPSAGTMTYTPGAGFTGSDSFTFDVNDGTHTSPAGTVSLTVGSAGGPAAGVNPANLTFASQGVGTSSATQTVTLTNSGTAVLTITSIASTGANAGDFSQTNTCGASVAAGANCTVTVTFKPTASGARAASITITDNAGNSPQSVSLTGTGAAAGTPQATLSPSTLGFPSQGLGIAIGNTLTLTNGGSAALAISSVAISGANASDFSLTPSSQACGTSLAAGANCFITVLFQPSAAGARMATVTVTDNAGNSPQTATLTGIGVVPTPVTLSPSSFAFGSLGVGSGTSTNFTLTNGSSVALAVTSMAITGNNASDFKVISPCQLTILAAGANCAIAVQFSPTAAGARTASLTVMDPGSNSPPTASLTGIGTDFTLTPSQGTATVIAGNPASFAIQLNATGAQQTISLACSGAPQGAVCTVPPPVSVTPGTAATASVSVSTRKAQAFLVPSTPLGTLPPAIGPFGLSLLALPLLSAWRKRNPLQNTPRHAPAWLLNPRLAMALPLVLLLASVAGLSGCGGGSNASTPPPPTGTPVGTYTLTVTATSNGVSHSTPLTLKVQ